MCERWTNGFLTIPAKNLGNERYHGHEHSHEAVLKDSKPDNLDPYKLPSTVQYHRALTLNHVNPLLGVLNIPLSPPQHFLIQVNGQTQPFGWIPLK